MIPNRRTPDVFKDVWKFLVLARPQDAQPIGFRPSHEALKLCEHIIEEEVNKELMPLLRKLISGEAEPTFENLTTLFDHYLDSMWVVIWGMQVIGMPENAGWNELARANMSKFPLVKDFPNGVKPLDIPEYKDVPYELTQRHGHWILLNKNTGKVMKPEGFTPPNIFDVVHGCLAIQKIRTQPDIIATPFMRDYFLTMEERFDRGEVQL